MNKQKLIIISSLVGGALIPLAVMGNHYMQTQGYQGLVNQANGLNGVSFHDNAYTSYCDQFALVSEKQAKLRLSQSCTSAIPTPTAALKSRWSTNMWGHKGWCRSVSAGASINELKIRETGLKNCMTNHGPSKADCLANDNFHKQAARGGVKYVKQCLKAGVDVNSRTRDGTHWTPLHSAARNGQVGIAKVLIANGALVNARDVSNRTPLDQASVGRFVNMQHYLRGLGGVTR